MALLLFCLLFIFVLITNVKTVFLAVFRFFFFIVSDGKFIVDPQYEGKIRAKVADVFQFRKEQEVDEHYKMIEEVLEDDKMVCPLFFFQFFGLHLVLQSFLVHIVLAESLKNVLFPFPQLNLCTMDDGMNDMNFQLKKV